MFEVINDYKVYLKNPDSLIIKEVKFTYEDDKGMTSTKERPACIINASAQNGFGGYASSYVLGTFNEDKGQYVFAGSCDSLDYTDYDSDEWLTALTAMVVSDHLENPLIEGVVDIDRVTTIITGGKYSSIKQIPELTFDQFSDVLFGEATEGGESNSESEGVLT